MIEDDPAIGQSLLDGFHTHGFDPYLCNTGTKGIEHAKKTPPHLIVLDIRLPDGSGFDFCRQMRGLGIKQPIIMLTAQHDEMDKILGLEMGADDYVTKPFSLRELTSRVRAEQSNKKFNMNVNGESLEVLGNEMQLRQVFVNLLENALKFTRPKDAISISASRLEDSVEIRISDSGIGVPANDLPNLFKRFHRGRNVSEYPGNGLGLAIVKAIVEAHGGEVHVRSAGLRKGSEFVVTLPLQITD